MTDNIARLKELFPEIITEGKIDFKTLQAILGEELEEEEEYYRFTWAGKAQARREAHKPSTGTLRPCKEDSVNWDTTQNLYLEGDNLEVLKLLQKSYANKVKMIYIDPPYNTGKDFVYKDNYKDSLKNYQQITGQVDDEGNKLSTNSNSDGRFHSNWLNMMYPRLQLARNLLKEDGVIFISIDDGEVHNLRGIANEIFGEENFINNIIWEKKYTVANDAKYFSDNHDHILMFCKSKENFSIGRLPRTEAMNDAYKNPDKHPKGVWKATPLQAKSGSDENFTHTFPNGINWSPPKGRYAAYSHETLDELYHKNEIWFGADGKSMPSKKTFLNELKSLGVVPRTILSFKEAGHNHESKEEIKNLFETGVFDTPKPTRLIRLLSIIANISDKDVVLDFFGGSSTTAHSIMATALELNKKINSITIQIPELVDEKSEAYKSGYKTITEIGKERIRRAGSKIIEEQTEKIANLKAKSESKMMQDEALAEITTLQTNLDNLDTGFKVFKLDTSNIKGWDGNPDNLEQSLFDSQDNIKTERTEEDVLYEILLKYGLDLTLLIEERVIEGKRVFNVGFGALFICLANDVTAKVAEGIGAWKEELAPATCRVIFKDSGFTDVEKTNAVQTLKRFGINEIKSI
ncbi:site-specific DNA-methyltransferase [Flavobacterium sandaracinum]|uniref:site-specific DNA-methyltransferase n=1 Tax=Flavobacterium sandaracinum TaxID=2541733 RepID=UPI001FB64D18|nr:site-specific DNA-methyltransferase [Flavobacterium sandaracinum]